MYHSPSVQRTADLTRRIRDLLREDIAAERFADGVLPGEEELRAEFGVSRSNVRDALRLLQDEGLVERVRGQGTFVTSGRMCQAVEEAHGMSEPADDSIWRGQMNTKIIDWSTIAATPTVARMLMVAVGTPVLRIDYLARLADVVIGQAANHLVYPEADLLAPAMLRVDFHEMLRRAGIAVGESTFLFDASVADEYDVELLGVTVGEPVMAVEQMIYSPDGRPLDAAFCRSPRNMAFLSRSGFAAAERGES